MVFRSSVLPLRSTNRSGHREIPGSPAPGAWCVMDVGLLLTVLIVLGGTQLVLRIAPPTAFDRSQLVELFSTPLVVGLIAARVVFVLLDHPASVFRIRDLMVVRSGVEFWAGVVVAMVWVAVKGRRSPGRADAVVKLAAAVPYLLVGVALYEASCLVRDGCLGPVASVGLVPNGLGSRMVPVGLLVAGALGLAAVVLHRAWMLEAEQTVLLAFVVLGGVRLVASWFLPDFGPSRVERESALALVLSVCGLIVYVARRRLARKAVPDAGTTVSQADVATHQGGVNTP